MDILMKLVSVGFWVFWMFFAVVAIGILGNIDRGLKAIRAELKGVNDRIDQRRKG